MVPGLRTSSGKWYKGQLHCHTLWSDGRAFPEQAIGCYRDDGYDFVSVTDHNRLSMDAGQWRPVCKVPGPWPTQPTEALLANARPRFPWLQTRSAAKGGLEVRLTPFRELQAHFNDPGRFLLMPGVEVTRAKGNWGEPTQRHVHMTYANLDEVIPSANGASLIQGMSESDSVAGIVRRTYGEIMSLAAAKGQTPGAITLCHPHWTFHDVLPQDLIDNPDVRFFEVCNGGGERDALPEFHHLGGFDNDRFWDVVNAFRARAGVRLLYATAVDDAHWYAHSGALTPVDCEGAYSGDGWVRVKAETLSPAALFHAMDRGDFYACCGLDLDDVTFDGRTLRVRTLPLPGVACTVRFIVTRRDFSDRVVSTVRSKAENGKGFAREVPVYSETIGRTVKTVVGRSGEAFEASYTLAADDLYVRARIESDRLSPYWTWSKFPRKHPLHPRFATVWTQPYIPM